MYIELTALAAQSVSKMVTTHKTSEILPHVEGLPNGPPSCINTTLDIALTPSS
jgi:hypothetical protein